MKTRSNPFAALALILVTSTSLQAATLYWNANSGTPDYSGAWDAVTSNWNTATAGAGTPITWTTGEDAEFDVAQTYTVTVDTAQTATNLDIKAGTVTFAGTSAISSNNIDIATGATLNTTGDRIAKAGTTPLTVNGTLNLTAGGFSSGRLIQIGGSGNLIGGFRHTGNASFGGNIQDVSSSSRAAILWNNGAAGTLTLSGSNSGMTGDVLMSLANSVIKLNSANAFSPNSLLRFEGAAASTLIELAATDFTRAFVTGSNTTNNGGFNWTGTNAGFYATGGDRNLTFVTAIGGTTPASVVWGTLGLTSSTVVLGAAASTHKLTWTNDINLNGATRTVSCADGAAAVETELTGIISNSSATAGGLTKGGTGYLLVSGSINDSAAGTIGLTAAGGTLRISGPLSFRGNVTVSGGNLLANRNDILGTGAGTTTCNGGNNQGTLQFDASGGDLSFPETITLQMRSSLVTSNTSPMKPSFNNLAGNTTLTGLINGTTGGAVTKISSDAGLLTISNELRQSGATPTVSTRGSTLQGAGNALISGTITQAAGITHRVDKMGSGTWTFSNAANTFSGGVRVNEGTLEVTGFGNGGAAGVLGAASNAAGNIQLNGGALKYSGSGETSDRLFTVGASGGTIEASGIGSLVLGNTGGITSADGGGTGLQFTFASGSTTLAVNDLSELSPGLEVGGYAGLDAGTKIVSIDYSAGLMTVDTATTAVSGAAASNGTASGVIDRVLTLTGSNTGANEIAGSLADAANGGKLAITKTGLGKWVLSGSNTYTGSTSVQTGTLALVGGSQKSPITVDSGAALGFTLGSPTTSTSSVTFIGATAKVAVSGTPVAATLMTASSITGTPVLDPAIPGFTLTIEDSGTTLKLKSTAANNYDTWATTNGVPGQAADLDHDNDGVSNGVEYFIGGPTGNTTGFTSVPSVTTTAGVSSITWTKAATYTGVYNTDYFVETSTSLATGSWATEASPGTVTISGNNVTYTFPAGPVKNFARLKVTGP
jgi:fibronectin-binding autotransporter adhesin